MLVCDVAAAVAGEKTFFGFGRADEDDLSIRGEDLACVRIDRQGAAGAHCDDIAARVSGDFGLSERFSGEGGGHVGFAHVETLCEHDDAGTIERVENCGGAHRGIGQNKIGPGAVQGRDIAFSRGAGDDLEVGPELSAIEGEIDVGIIIVSGNDDGGRLFHAGPLEGGEIRGAPEDVVVFVGDPLGKLLDDAVIDFTLGERAGGGAADAPATDDDDVADADMVDAEELVIGGELLLRAGEEENGIGINPGVGGGRSKCPRVQIPITVTPQ